MSGRIGILAGGGVLPLELAGVLKARGRPYHIVALRGFADSAVSDHPHTWIGLGQLGALLDTLATTGCRELVILGTLARPDLLALRIDFGAIRHARAVLALTRGGDDSLLRKVVRFFEGQGLVVRGVAEIAPELVAPAGRIAGPPLGDDTAEALAVGRAALAALSGYDVGQAVVATRSGVVAFEDGSGTARMLSRLAERLRDAPKREPTTAAETKVLVKLPKAGQELRIDLPTIGAATVAQASDAGISAIVVAAGATQLADRVALTAACEAAGIGLYGVDPPADVLPAGDCPATVRSSSDAALATEIAKLLLRLAGSEACDAGVVVRDGYALALMVDGVAEGRWPRRLAQLPSGWWGSLRLRRAGHLALAFKAKGVRTAETAAVVDIARAAERARLASIGLDHAETTDSKLQPLVSAARSAVRSLTVTLGTPTHTTAET